MKYDKVFLMPFLATLFSFIGVFANPIQDGLGTLREIMTNDVVVSGIAVLMIYWGLYAMFFWGTRFFAKAEGGGHHRVRVAISVVLSFFVGSFFILSLDSAGDQLGYVAAAWLVLILLIALFFVGVLTLYKQFFGYGASQKAKDVTRITLFILTLLIFLFIYSLVFAKVSYVVLSDGQGSFTIFEPGTVSGDVSVEGMLEEIEQEARNEGGVSGSLIGIMASLLSSIFSFIFSIALIALFVFLAMIISRHKLESSNGGSKSKNGNPKNDMRDLIKQIATKLDELNASFNRKLTLAQQMQRLNKQRKNSSSSTSSSGVESNDDQQATPEYPWSNDKWEVQK